MANKWLLQEVKLFIFNIFSYLIGSKLLICYPTTILCIFINYIQYRHDFFIYLFFKYLEIKMSQHTKTYACVTLKTNVSIVIKCNAWIIIKQAVAYATVISGLHPFNFCCKYSCFVQIHECVYHSVPGKWFLSLHLDPILPLLHSPPSCNTKIFLMFYSPGWFYLI